MKVNTTKVKEEFKPRTTCITFESEAEYNLFRKIMGHSLTVPEAILYNKTEQKAMTEIMVSVFETMPELP